MWVQNNVSWADFSGPLGEVVTCHKGIWCNRNITRQSAKLVVNLIRVNNFISFFNCTPIGRTSDPTVDLA